MFSKFIHKFLTLTRLIQSEIVKTEQLIQQMQTLSMSCIHRGISSSVIINSPLVVSLTTYSERIHDVHLTIESIMQQTVLPNRIILWLDENEFDDTTIPIVLKKQIKRGLEIRYCKNIKSFKKLMPTLNMLPDATIITVDDDVIYPYDMIERMMYAYREDPRCIYYYRGRIIGKNGNKVKPYNKWKMVTTNEKMMNVIPTGIGGILYPSGCFHKDVTNEKLFMGLCPQADDIWFRAMTMLKDYPCQKIDYSGSFRYSFINIESNQSIALSNANFFNNNNDVQFKNVFEKYNLLGI